MHADIKFAIVPAATARIPSRAYNFDAFDNTMPPIDLNEHFESPGCAAPVNSFCKEQNNNWPKPTATPLAATGYSGTGYCWDTLFIYDCPTCSPATSNVQSPLSASKVDYSKQTWHLGSTTENSGILVQEETFQRYLDHGAHEAVSVPH